MVLNAIEDESIARGEDVEVLQRQRGARAGQQAA